MKTYIISDEDKHRIETTLYEYAPIMYSEVVQKRLVLQRLSEAVIVPATSISRSVVTIESIVRVVNLRLRFEEAYTLVLPHNSSVAHRRVSLLSPLGAAILGCTEGMLFEIEIPGSRIPFSIRKVVYQPHWSPVANPEPNHNPESKTPNRKSKIENRKSVVQARHEP